jgi:hypothetical protein
MVDRPRRSVLGGSVVARKRAAKTGDASRPSPRAGRAWWEQPEGTIAKVVDAMATRLWQQDAPRRAELELWFSLYIDEPPSTELDTARARRPIGRLPYRTETGAPSYNVIRSIAQTIDADIGAVPPAVRFLTDNGDWELRQKAKARERFANGIAYDTHLDRVFERMRMLGCVTGTGIVHPYRDGETIRVDVVLPHELLVDADDARLGDPRTLVRVQFVDRARLAARFGGDDAAVAAIWRARGADAQDTIWTTEDASVDLVRIVTAWHLPSEPDAEDGVVMQEIGGTLLSQAEYMRDTYPFPMWRFDDDPTGYWGRGVAAQLEREQRAVTRQLRYMEDALRGSVPFIVLHSGANIEETQISNAPWKVYKSDVGAPGMTVHTQPVVTGDRSAYLEGVIRRCYEQLGASQLAATGQKPAGLDSGKALETYSDQMSLRHLARHRRYEAAARDTYAAIFDLAAELHADGVDLVVTYRDARTIERVDFADIAAHPDDFRIEIASSASSPRTPMGRMAWIEQKMRLGMMTPEEGAAALEDLDPAAQQSRASVDRQAVETMLETMLDAVSYVYPDPLLSLDMQMRVALERYADGVAYGMDEERMGMLRQFVADVKSAQAELAGPGIGPAAPPPVEAMPPPPGGPPAEAMIQ